MAISSKATPEMKKELLQFQIEQLRSEKVSCATDGVLVAVLGILSAVFLPEMILRIVLANNPNLTQPPVLLTYLPYIAYGISFLYGIWVLVVNGMRQKKIAEMFAELTRSTK